MMSVYIGKASRRGYCSSPQKLASVVCYLEEGLFVVVIWEGSPYFLSLMESCSILIFRKFE